MYTVMTVCTGNICRSPMAEIILRTEFERRGLADKVNVESSGVSDEEYGNPIDRRAVKVLRERGYELPAHHFAHRITRDEIERTDQINLTFVACDRLGKIRIETTVHMHVLTLGLRQLTQ